MKIPRAIKNDHSFICGVLPHVRQYQKYSMLNSLFLTILEIGYPKFQKASGFAQDHPVNNPRTRGFRTSPMCSQILCICEKVPCTSLSLAVGKDWVCRPRDASEFRRSKGYSTNHSGRAKQTVQENIQVRLPTCLTRIGKCGPVIAGYAWKWFVMKAHSIYDPVVLHPLLTALWLL